MRLLCAVPLITGLSLVGMNQSLAYLASGEIHLRVDLFESSGQGRVEPLCTAEWAVESTVIEHWTLEHGRAEVPGTAVSSGKGISWSCEQGIAENPRVETSPGAACSDYGVEIDLNSGVSLQMEEERTLVVRLEIRPLPDDCEKQEDNAQPDVGLTRTFYFPDDAETYLPVSAALPGIDGSPGNGIFIRLTSALESPARQSASSRISLTTDIPGATVLLDGGQVGTVAGDGSFEVDFVRPGMRKVTLRSASGDELTQFVEVKPGRTYWVELKNNKGSENPFLLKKLTANDAGYSEYLRMRDAMTMIEVPEGEFLMGNPRTERTPAEHMVYLSTFLIDKTAVTWKQYKQFVASTGIPMPPHQPYWGVHDDHPAVYVTWQEARDYCQWAGGRLPTEAEREKAARGTDGRLYPWGEQPPDPKLAVFRRTWGNEATDPVGIRPLGASPYGALDMGGNVWEWCSDWYSDEYLESSPYENPPGPESGTRHVVRGGSWDSRPDVTSASCRNWGHPGYREGDFGFRCAMNAPSD